MSVLQAIGAVPVDCIPCRSSAVGIHTPGPAARNRPHLTAHMLLPGALAGHCQRGRSPVIRDAKAGGGDGLTGKSMLAHTMVPSSSAAWCRLESAQRWGGPTAGGIHCSPPSFFLLFFICAQPHRQHPRSAQGSDQGGRPHAHTSQPGATPPLSSRVRKM